MVFPLSGSKGQKGALQKGEKIHQELPVQIIAYKNYSFVVTQSGRVYSWGSPPDDPTKAGFLGRKISDATFDVKLFEKTEGKQIQTTRSDEPGQVLISHHVKVKRIEVRDGRFIAYLNNKFMHFDEKKHGALLKPNSLIKLWAKQSFIPDYDKDQGNKGRKVQFKDDMDEHEESRGNISINKSFGKSLGKGDDLSESRFGNESLKAEKDSGFTTKMKEFVTETVGLYKKIMMYEQNLDKQMEPILEITSNANLSQRVLDIITENED